MSTRFYPRFVKGNPQLKIFLPDWRLVMMKPKHSTPENVVCFKIDPRMTDWDVKNYLEKIYKVQVASIRSKICPGPLKYTRLGMTKGEDFKLADVTLPLGQKFTWPDLFPEDKRKETLTEYEETLKELNENRTKDLNVRDIPSWFV